MVLPTSPGRAHQRVLEQCAPPDVWRSVLGTSHASDVDAPDGARRHRCDQSDLNPTHVFHTAGGALSPAGGRLGGFLAARLLSADAFDATLFLLTFVVLLAHSFLFLCFEESGDFLLCIAG